MPRFKVYGVRRDNGKQAKGVVEAADAEEARQKASSKLEVTRVEAMEAEPKAAQPAVAIAPPPPPPPPHPPTQPAPATTTVNITHPPSNGLGTASFVTAIVSWLTCGFLAPVAFLMGLVALTKRPRGMAIGGLCVSGLALIPMALILMMMAGVVSAPAILAASGTLEQFRASQAIQQHYSDHGVLPTEAEAQAIFQQEGVTLEYAPVSADRFELRLDGGRSRVWEHQGGEWNIAP